jgi:nitroreductase/dihydropteridine reductase
MSLNDAINWRYPVKKLTPDTLSSEQLSNLIESIRLAPSAYGIRPYQLIAVTNPDIKQACLPFSYGQDKVANCLHLLVLAYKTELKQHDISTLIKQLAVNQGKSVNPFSSYQTHIESDLLTRTATEQRSWTQQQSYIAVGILLASAATSSIDACPITGLEVDGMNEVLGLNEKGLSAVVLCPIGIRSVDDHAAYRPKHRFSQYQLVIRLYMT